MPPLHYTRSLHRSLVDPQWLLVLSWLNSWDVGFAADSLAQPTQTAVRRWLTLRTSKWMVRAAVWQVWNFRVILLPYNLSTNLKGRGRPQWCYQINNRAPVDAMTKEEQIGLLFTLCWHLFLFPLGLGIVKYWSHPEAQPFGPSHCVFMLPNGVTDKSYLKICKYYMPICQLIYHQYRVSRAWHLIQPSCKALT